MIFAQYLDNHLKDFDETWSEVRQNGYKSDGLRYSGSYQPKFIKIDLNLWMIQCSHIQISGVHISCCLFGLVEDDQQSKVGGYGHHYANELRYGKSRWGHRLGDETNEETVTDVDLEIKGTI